MLNKTISKADVGDFVKKALNKQNEYNRTIFANSGGGGGGIKDTVATYDSLPANAAAGDMYLINDTGNLAYFADSWKVCLTSNDIWLDTLDGGS